MQLIMVEENNSQGIIIIIETPVSLSEANLNEVSVRNANDPMPTGQGEIGTILLSPSEDGNYSDTLYYYLASY